VPLPQQFAIAEMPTVVIKEAEFLHGPPIGQQNTLDNRRRFGAIEKQRRRHQRNGGIGQGKAQ
jgi:hypothetical protein